MSAKICRFCGEDITEMKSPGDKPFLYHGAGVHMRAFRMDGPCRIMPVEAIPDGSLFVWKEKKITL